MAELAAVRRCLSQYRYMAPATVRNIIGDSGELYLGVFPTSEARSIVETARGEGLEVVTADASFVSYLPQDRTTGCAWIIEDEAESQAVATSMLAAGIPVQDVEAYPEPGATLTGAAISVSCGGGHAPETDRQAREYLRTACRPAGDPFSTLHASCELSANGQPENSHE